MRKEKKSRYMLCLAVLTAILICSLITACSDAKEPNNEQTTPEEQQDAGYNFGFIGDLHVLSEDLLEDDDCPSFQAYSYNGQRIIPLASAILKTAVDKYIEDKVDAVFICGELSENGSYASLEEVAKQCQRLEDAGIPTFVTNGCDDIFNLPFSYSYSGSQLVPYCMPSQFRELFANFGYNEAIDQDEETLSYVCDVPGTNVRLINISTDYYIHRDIKYYDESIQSPVLSERMLDWIESHLKLAQQDKKEVLVMSYFPMTDVMGEAAGLVLTNYALKLENSDIALYMFAEYGVKYVLSGHMHIDATTKFYDESTGNTVTNLTVGCLSNYPMSLVYLNCNGSEWKHTTKQVIAIKEEYVPNFCSEEIKEAVTTDLHAYAMTYLKTELHKELQSILDRRGEKNGLIIHWLEVSALYDDDNPSQESLELVDVMYNIYAKFIDLPIYGEDSVQSIMLKYGMEMPEDSRFIDFTFSDLLIYFFCQIYNGTADLSPDSYDSQFVINSVYALLDIIADADFAGHIKAIVPSTVLFDLHPVIQKIIQEGILDLKTDDLLLKVASLFSPIIKQRTDIEINFMNASVDTLLDAIKLVLRPILKITLEDFFDEKNNTIYGYALTDYFDFDKGYIYTRKLFSEVFFNLFASIILNQDKEIDD